jgi:hypothetical protein
MRLTSHASALPAADESAVESIQSLLKTVDPALLDDLARRDLERARGAYDFIASWWQQLRTSAKGTASERLEHLLQSRIHELLGREQVLLRFSLEARLVGELIPSSRAQCDELHTRLIALHESITTDVRQLWSERSGGIWREIVEHT